MTTARIPESTRMKRYAHYATNSPLKPSRDEIFRAAMKERKMTRGEFVLDGVRENTKHSSVIPSYNAFNDRHSQVYFRSPRVQAMLKRIEDSGKDNPSLKMVDFKLSTRRRIPPTPYKESVVSKEERFVIDCVRTDALKSKRRPVIPQYNAMDDEHSQGYFKKRSVKDLLKRTLDVSI